MIDFHIHFCDREKYPDFQALADRLAIERGALVSLPDLNRREGTYNTEVIHAVRQDPDRWFAFGALDHRQDGNGRVLQPYSEQVNNLYRQGFSGLKVWLGKPLAERLFSRDVRDPGIQEAFAAAGELRMPVLYHVADPPDFWEAGGPCSGEEYSPFDRYIDDLIYCVERNPGVTFIVAHLMFLADRLDELSSILVRHPNLYTDTAPGRWFYAVLAQEGRQARSFFKRNSTQVLFGSDALFFPDSYGGLGSMPSLDETAATIRRIERFLATGEELDNPYPGSRERFPTVEGLRVNGEALARIMHGNALVFFLKRGGVE